MTTAPGITSTPSSMSAVAETTAAGLTARTNDPPAATTASDSFRRASVVADGDERPRDARRPRARRGRRRFRAPSTPMRSRSADATPSRVRHPTTSWPHARRTSIDTRAWPPPPMTSTPASTAVTVVPAIREPSDAARRALHSCRRRPKRVAGLGGQSGVCHRRVDEPRAAGSPGRAERRAAARLPADPVRRRRRRLGRRRARSRRSCATTCGSAR